MVFTGTMIEEMIISFNSVSKRTAWYEYMSKTFTDNTAEDTPETKPKSVQSSTMPPQVCLPAVAIAQTKLCCFLFFETHTIRP